MCFLSNYLCNQVFFITMVYTNTEVIWRKKMSEYKIFKHSSGHVCAVEHCLQLTTSLRFFLKRSFLKILFRILIMVSVILLLKMGVLHGANHVAPFTDSLAHFWVFYGYYFKIAGIAIGVGLVYLVGMVLVRWHMNGQNSTEYYLIRRGYQCVSSIEASSVQDALSQYKEE